MIVPDKDKGIIRFIFSEANFCLGSNPFPEKKDEKIFFSSGMMMVRSIVRGDCPCIFQPLSSETVVSSVSPLLLRYTPQCYGRLMSGLLLSLFFQPLCHYVPPSPLWLRYTLQCFGARQGRSLKVTLYSYRLSHNNGERRGKFFCEKRLFCYLSSAKRRYKLWGNEYI